MAVRAAHSLINDDELPRGFVLDVLEKLGEIIPGKESLTCTYMDSDVNTKAKDEQLLMWLNRWVKMFTKLFY